MYRHSNSQDPTYRPMRLLLSITALTMLAWSGASTALETAALDSNTFGNALAEAHSMPRLRSLLISQGDNLVVETYFNGTRAGDTANVKSVSKSIMSALVGAAIASGHITGIDQPISDYYPQIAEQGDPRKRQITVGNLLSMQAGLETTSFYNYGSWVLSDDWVRYALEQPLRSDPGTRLVYSTGNTHLLSAIITAATGSSTLQFARKKLAAPLGFELLAWPQDPNGIYFGGNNMELTPKQMLRFGQLYLNDGRANGNQILPQTWVTQSLQPRVESPRENDRYYGYGWWIKSMAGFEVPYAWGYGGQFILLVPDLDLVVVTTSNSEPGPNRRAHIRGLYRLIEDEIVSTAAAALIRPPLSPRLGAGSPSSDGG